MVYVFITLPSFNYVEVYIDLDILIGLEIRILKSTFNGYIYSLKYVLKTSVVAECGCALICLGRAHGFHSNEKQCLAG